MKSFPKILLFIALLVSASFVSGPMSKKPDIEGEWIGGYKVKDKWVCINANFRMEAGIIKANIDLPFKKEVQLAPTRVIVEHSQVQFVIQNGRKMLLFNGKCNVTTISGYVKHTSKEGIFHLFRVTKKGNILLASKMSTSQP